ncbi:Calpain-1 catalytic subunit [Anabarilius grahami]|uniref:Calpain-1 catalytic subunit n=1 Tax=Anabarilius grahami TaxID=495550 RepID=A0A3N0Z034_ANAGA|nr:Calpain-1 catalytic subunit [Anabarilius grahami]
MPPPHERHDTTDHDVGSPTNPMAFLGQDFQKLLHKSLSRNKLYIDELFPPNNSSIGTLDKEADLDYNNIVWKRPSFWRFGKWIDVVVDDLLPTIDGDLIFVGSKTSNEFWPTLLEKAYAKVCGSYGDLDGGFISEALMDFTGGVHMEFMLNKAPAHLWNIMDRAAKSQTLMGCGTYQGESREAVSSSGIVGGHAYTVTGVCKVMSKGNPVHLVRVLNPWGDTEWNKDWSDKMSMEDFTRNFESLDICCLCPDFLDRSSGCHWKSQRNFGKWIAGTTAGGSLDNIGTFWKNPQFRVRIEELSEDCTHEEGAENVLVSLMQNHEKRNRSSQENYKIGLYIFKMRGESGKFSAKFFSDKTPVVVKAFEDLREVMEFFWLEPGEYLIVPCTENPGETASFVLSIFSKHETHFE